MYARKIEIWNSYYSICLLKISKSRVEIVVLRVASKQEATNNRQKDGWINSLVIYNLKIVNWPKAPIFNVPLKKSSPSLGHSHEIWFFKWYLAWPFTILQNDNITISWDFLRLTAPAAMPRQLGWCCQPEKISWYRNIIYFVM